MPHFITVPEIIDSSTTPYTVKDRHLNVDHIVSFYDTAEGRCSVKTTVKESLDVLLSASELRKLCSPETVTVKGERRPLSMEDLGRFIARSQEPFTVMEPGMGHNYPRMADVGEPAEEVTWDYEKVKLSEVEVNQSYAWMENTLDGKVTLYHLPGYAMSTHPHKTAVSTGLLARYNEACKRSTLPYCRADQFKVVVSVRPLTGGDFLDTNGFEFEDHTQDDKVKTFPLWPSMIRNSGRSTRFLIGEALKVEDITVGPLYLIVAKPEKRLNLFRINSNAQTQHNLRRVYQALQKEFTERNLTDVLGPMEYWTLGRAATYNHEFVVFHVTPFHSEGELATTQQWTVDKRQIVVPENAILNDVNKGS